MPNKTKYMGPTPYMQTDMENQNAAIKASPASRKISADIATKLKTYGPGEKNPASYAQKSRWRDEKKTLPSRKKKNDNPLINVRKSYQE